MFHSCLAISLAVNRGAHNSLIFTAFDSSGAARSATSSSSRDANRLGCGRFQPQAAPGSCEANRTMTTNRTVIWDQKLVLRDSRAAAGGRGEGDKQCEAASDARAAKIRSLGGRMRKEEPRRRSRATLGSVMHACRMHECQLHFPCTPSASLLC